MTIDITLSRNGKDITSCGCALPEEQEQEVYFALRKALLNYHNLIYEFGEKK